MSVSSGPTQRFQSIIKDEFSKFNKSEKFASHLDSELDIGSGAGTLFETSCAHGHCETGPGWAAGSVASVAATAVADGGRVGLEPRLDKHMFGCAAAVAAENRKA